MELKDGILRQLEERRGEYVSGESLSSMAGVSRQAVWKAVKKLTAEGYVIHSSTNRGYMLDGKCDLLSASVISAATGAAVECYDCVPTTNAVALKKFCEDGECIVVSDGQSDGKTKDGGNFYSPRGKGVYFSIAMHLNIPIERTDELRALCGSAVAEVIELTCKKRADTVRLDEIYIDGKKVAGILTECILNSATKIIHSAVIGVGIYTSETCFADAGYASVFPDETRNKMIAEIYLKIKKALS
ncbi:MAG: HTH domain-containing protein [Candidatus Coproplasma sp.]